MAHVTNDRRIALAHRDAARPSRPPPPPKTRTGELISFAGALVLLALMFGFEWFGLAVAKPASFPLSSPLIEAIFGLGAVGGFFNRVGLAPRT